MLTKDKRMIIIKALKKSSLRSFACLLIVIFSTQSNAAQLYRYKNEQGNLVMGQAIPPKFVANGYDILNAQGRTIETVPPALSTEEIAKRDALLEQAEQERLALEIQSAIDDKLKQLYSHPDDAVRILQRRTQDINSVITAKTSRIESAKKQIIEQEQLAANRQRDGLPIPKPTLEKLAMLKKVISNAQADILELEQEFKDVLAEFDVKIRRLEEITLQKSDKYAALLDSLNKPASPAQ